jgi:hypothetical protein
MSLKSVEEDNLNIQDVYKKNPHQILKEVQEGTNSKKLKT